jgi:hypothetical protein
MPTNSNASCRRLPARSLIALAALFCALAFLGATRATATAQASPLTYWDQPDLTNPTTITVSDTNRTLNLSPSQDYIINCPAGVLNLSGKITVWGGHNVVFQNCNEYVATGAGDWAGNFQNQTGTLWIHDVHFGGVHLTGGIQLQASRATPPTRACSYSRTSTAAPHPLSGTSATSTSTARAPTTCGWPTSDPARSASCPRQSIVGDVAQVAIYGYALTQAQDANHWAVGQGQSTTGN